MNLHALSGALALVAASAAVACPQAGPAPPGPAELQAWVHASYPALVQGIAMPEGLHFGFVVTPDHKVVAHSAIFRPAARPISRDLEAMFPDRSLVGSPMAGIARVSTGDRRTGYGVIWIMLPDAE